MNHHTEKPSQQQESREQNSTVDYSDSTELEVIETMLESDREIWQQEQAEIEHLGWMKAHLMIRSIPFFII